MTKKNLKFSLSDLVIKEIDNQIKRGVNKKEFEDILHPIIKNRIKEWIK
ncbi:hypothetical protein LCGC14_1674500 [marine sediment metagenome]|uniref:Uncharacterized protein n=1 Tax=marine sediment metagenome TaxID=412755 RepID=A0A0F9K691_9ZZZZ